VTHLAPELRSQLEKAVLAARDTAEAGARAALDVLGVEAREAFTGISEEDRRLRVGLRARARALGQGSLTDGMPLLVEEVAYEQWHHMLFARFLAENGLLIHPEHGVAVSLSEVAELAREAGESDPWLVAARYAERMLPGIFRTDDPSAQVSFAPDQRQALERILAELPADVFTADDALGWVYQFWQTKRKKEVNASGRKIGGADIAPVTQLFTEPYMVRFLLENSLGAWWVSRHPESPLREQWEYLRFRDDGTPAAGSFEGWPETAAEVTVIDPCCGSGHFLVVAADMLRQMRMEEERLSEAEAGHAVLADNLFGLELDPRCTQIAAFALAFDAWRHGGDRELPLPNIACSGIAVRGQLEDWTRLAGGDPNLVHALTRLYELFKDAPDLGSLIDPTALSTGGFFDADPDTLLPLLERALAKETDDPAAAVFGAAAEGAAKAARLLAGKYWLVATNPPYLSAGKFDDALKAYLRAVFPHASGEIAIGFHARSHRMAEVGAATAMVLPAGWLFLSGFRRYREFVLSELDPALVAWLGPRAFTALSGEVVNAVLAVTHRSAPGGTLAFVDVQQEDEPKAKARTLPAAPLGFVDQQVLRDAPDSRITPTARAGGDLLERRAEAFAGIQTGDAPRFVRTFWEQTGFNPVWHRMQTTVASPRPWGGLEHAIRWEDGRGSLHLYVAERLGGGGTGAWLRGGHLRGKTGVAVSLMGSLPVALFAGELFDLNMAVVEPKDPKDLAALWAFAASGSLSKSVRAIDTSIKLTNRTLTKVPFDLEHWTKVAEEQYPNGLPEPHSDDPTQWLFRGHPKGSEDPLQVAVARLLGYRWPDQEPDELDRFADPDGIVCLPPVLGEPPAAERLRELLATAWGSDWSAGVLDQLLSEASAVGKGLDVWLRDEFFAAHARRFHNRPFIWHITDGRRDGFSALVNYHRLDHAMLSKLTYSYLGWWIDRQRAARDAGEAGADGRLVAALELQDKLQLILAGEPPYDIHVRWKSLAQQPIGWHPDLDDGVRLNIRPFVTASVLRAKFTIHWNKDRGRNPDGSERINDRHFTTTEKRTAREGRG
jgi:hypothetical protein